MEKIVSTVEELESVLLVAFGPCGQAVLVQQPTGQFTITRSGLDILTAYFPSPQKNPYLRVLLDCVRTLHKDLGDGVNDADNRGSLDDLDIQCEVNRVIQEHKATKKESKDSILGILLLTSVVLPDLSIFCLGREGVSIVQGIPFEEMGYIHSVLMTLQHSTDTDCLILAVKSETVGSKEYTWLDLPNVSQLILSAPTPEICLLYSQACNNALKLVSGVWDVQQQGVIGAQRQWERRHTSSMVHLAVSRGCNWNSGNQLFSCVHILSDSVFYLAFGGKEKVCCPICDSCLRLRLESQSLGMHSLSLICDTRVAPRMLGWNVPAEELVHIPEHWMSYPEPNPLYHYTLALLYTVFCFVAVIGNGLVIWIFTSAKSLQTPSNVFVVNLAICDFMMMMKTPIFIYNSFNLGFASGFLGCQIFAFVGSLSGIGAGMTNAFIAYDRYRTIAKPFGGKLTSGKAIMMVLVIWAYTIPWAVMPLLEFWGRFAPEGFLTSCSFDFLEETSENHSFVMTIFVFSYVIPMSFIIYFYSQIVAKKMNVDSLRSNQAQNQTSAEIRIAKAAISICFLFVAAWTPYAVMALIGAFGNKAMLTPGVTMIPACTCKLVACLDPYVYAISHPRYRVELQKRVPWLSIKESQGSSETSSVVTTNSATTTN
uniref:G-protein coupled receptors family 1 profile domain-containing protein n=2 Tax=Timema TaxID=61471 RepID=A0A7R9EV08_9NEOP|nr:unnamed protein product [Timema bartmani]